MKTGKNSESRSQPAVTARRFGRERRRFWIGLGASIALAGGVALWATQQRDDDENAQAPTAQSAAPRVTVSQVERREVVERQERLGRVAAIESVELRPEVSGKITAVRFNAGELVEAGQVLFEIDNSQYSAIESQARANVERAKARASTAEREALRADSLFQKRAISSEEAETRQSLAAEARAELLAAQAEMDKASLDLARTVVRAPISGRVSRAYVTQGNLVSGAPGAATLLTSIVSVGQVHVYVDLDDATAQRLRRAMLSDTILRNKGEQVPVELRLGDEGEYTNAGYVESLDNQVDPEKGSLTVRMVFDDADGLLLPGMFARVRIPLGASEQTLVVSEKAIGTDQSQKYVLVVGSDSKVSYRPVAIGKSLGSDRIVLNGVEPGERVIVNGLQRVRPGMVVEPEVLKESYAQVALR